MADTHPCCSVSIGRTHDPEPPLVSVRPAGVGVGREWVDVPAGRFAMGDGFGEGYPADGETPVHDVDLAAFRIAATTVTNAEFAAFISATGYRTDAERFGSSAVFYSAARCAEHDVLGRLPEAPWWLEVRGADWRRPEGGDSDLADRADHPVVHVSWADAAAYCRWSATRLPTEAEWELAARGGLAGRRFPWGDVLVPDGAWRCNIWQGRFPTENTAADGYVTTAPVRAYAPNGLGVWNAVGNVWEWCADWFDSGYYARSPLHDPPGPDSGDRRVVRGGSYLCHESYCYRYRVAARSSNTVDSSAANLGFRVVAI